jgi:Na+/H+ antiporter NhaC
LQEISVGIWSILPPIVAITLAIVTKEIVSSLVVGLLSGILVYVNFARIGFFSLFKILLNLISGSLASNALTIIFVSLLGALSQIIIDAGGARGYVEWASRKIKSRRMAQVFCFMVSLFLAIDDYFSCLTVGAVMRPIAKRYKISSAKFAYMIDSMAAPMCVLMPISTWTSTVISCFSKLKLNGMKTFINLIPYNFYAVLSVLTILAVVLISKDFGSFEKIEKNDENEIQKKSSDLSENNIKAKTSNLIVPILVLILISIFMILETGGFFAGQRNFTTILEDSDLGISISIGSLIAIFISFVLTVPMTLKFKDFMFAIDKGIKSMVPAFVILILAWSMTSVCNDLLAIGKFVGGLILSSNFNAAFLPVFIFISSSILSFSIGSAWGTFGMLIPVAGAICQQIYPEMMLPAIAAVLSGAVFGDNSSPISDTTILAAASADCEIMEHVSTQLPFTLCVALASCIAFLVFALSKSILFAYISAFATILAEFLISKIIKTRIN